MNAGTAPAIQRRTRARHELRSLTYVTLDQANGGIVRNLSREGIAVQAVAAVRPLQELRVRFELRYPKLRVEARGHVVWSTFSGQCGIRFLDLDPALGRHIQEWIFGNLLEQAAMHAEHAMFPVPALGESACVEEDGLLVSPTPVRVIDLPPLSEAGRRSLAAEVSSSRDSAALDWLFPPVSGAALIWAVNGLALVAGLLLFAVIFLSVTHESPTWPVILAAATLVPGMYWGFFRVFGGTSLGTRLARLTENEDQEEAAGARFR